MRVTLKDGLSLFSHVHLSFRLGVVFPESSVELLKREAVFYSRSTPDFKSLIPVNTVGCSLVQSNHGAIHIM